MRANTLQERAQFFFCNCHRIVSNGHIAPVVENNLVSLFDSSFILRIIIYSSWGASVTYPKQCISVLKASLCYCLKSSFSILCFACHLFFPKFFLLYIYSVFLNETAFYILKVLAISQLLLKCYFENEGIKNSIISCYIII